MRVFVTGATGFIGGRLARALRGRGDDVVALVRDPDRATALRGLGCQLVEGDLGTLAGEMLAGCEVVVHSAAVYRVGVDAEQAVAMRATNVTGTERVIDTAVAAGVGRIVYVSTVNTFGDT
jgi:nucleoside-diphosphate-sugar epimerase